LYSLGFLIKNIYFRVVIATQNCGANKQQAEAFPLQIIDPGFIAQTRKISHYEPLNL